MTTILIPWSNDKVFAQVNGGSFVASMISFGLADEGIVVDLWDWFADHEEPIIDYETYEADEVTAFTFQNEDIALLFKLTYGGN